jgi:biopolymer transport protein ExbB
MIERAENGGNARIMRIDERLLAIAQGGAGWVMWLLVGLSVLGFWIVLERAIALALSRDDIPRLKSDLLALLQSGELDAARHLLAQSPSFEARVVIAGLLSAESGAPAAEERMTSEAQFAKLTMERRLGILGTLGSNAPFVGLLGTVVDVIRAFRAHEASEGQISAHLMSEIADALEATAVGFVVALPAVAFFNFFQGVITARLTRADALGRELLAYLKAAPLTKVDR